MTQLEADLDLAKLELKKFPHLNSFLNWSSIESQAAKKYPAGITNTLNASAGKPFDILQAILAPAILDFGPLDYKTNLEALDNAIGELLPIMNSGNQTALKNKISNIGTASFWDTLGELWFALIYQKSGQDIKVDFPLHPPVGNNTPSDADIAFVDKAGNPLWLFDAVCPNMPASLDQMDGFFNPAEAKKWIENAIEKKFQNKFAPYIAAHAPAKAAIIVILIKADMITGHLSPLLIMNPGQPVQLDPRLKTKCPGLGYAIAVRFQKNAAGKVEFVKVAELP
jgi:hypothetical protein